LIEFFSSLSGHTCCKDKGKRFSDLSFVRIRTSWTAPMQGVCRFAMVAIDSIENWYLSTIVPASSVEYSLSSSYHYIVR